MPIFETGRSLVTGGAGFIGSRLACRLASDGGDVIVVDNFSARQPAALPRTVRVIEADVRDRERLKEAMAGVEVVYHQAALPSVPVSIEDPWSSNEHNVAGTLGALLAARDAGVRRFVYASSSAIYGDEPSLPRRELAAAAPLSPYAVSKYAGELYCQVFFRVYGLETVSLRYFNVFGSGDSPTSSYSAVVPRFITALRKQESPLIYGDGGQTRDFIYIDNVVQANLDAAAASAESAAGEVFNIGSGVPITIRGLLEEIQAVLGTNLKAVEAPAQPGDVRHSFADISRAREVLDYRPSIDLSEGLRRTIAAFLPDPA